MKPLHRLRIRLTAWYAATFTMVLVVLGAGLFWAITRQISQEMDRALQTTVLEAFRAARIRMAEGHTPVEAFGFALDELDTPDRALYLFDSNGVLLLPHSGSHPRITEAAVSALVSGSARFHFGTPSGQRWRVHAQRIHTTASLPFVVAAAADAASVERQYARMIEIFVAAGLIVLLPVTAGGYWLARMSARPLEESMERMRQFTANAAHELRTPVAVVRGRAEVALERERSPHEYTTALVDIEQEAERLSGIVDHLFTLARADAGERPVIRERVYLDDVASDAVAAASVLARSRGVRLELGTYEEAPMRGDPALLRQLVMILLDNALKFTPEGRKVQVNVSAAGGTPTLVVEDEGIGIASEDQPRIFDRFYRADAARDRAGGAGLGLAIAHWIAEVHDAHITVQSGPDRGTRFTITFPSTL